VPGDRKRGQRTFTSDSLPHRRLAEMNFDKTFGTLALFAVLAATPHAQSSSPTCRVSGSVLRLQDLPEASGLAASRRMPGVFWSHNDSGDPVVFALTSTGAVRDRVRVTGANVDDWEDIAVGACPQGSCLYIADIGDNAARRRSITVYRVAEPAAGATQTERAETMRATYPDGPQDAETLLVLPSGHLLIVTKGETGAVALYRSPSIFQHGAAVSLERVATLVPAVGRGNSSRVARPSRVTGGDVSMDGRWIVLRTGTTVQFYDARQLAAGTVREVSRLDVSSLREPQGEGVAFTADAEVWLASEGSGKSQPGSLARLSCTLP
jgi:hypothetical protein